jgi:DNA-directed RNA polymerase specialized sigma24 family protein
MNTHDFSGPSAYDSDLGLNECVEKYYPLILALARNAAPANIGPVDYEDIAQDAFLKLLLISQKQSIESPKAYIRRIVHTVVVDMARKYKPHLCQAFSTDEDGEIQEGKLVGMSSAELRNPETILEEKEAVDERMQELVGAISAFHLCQRQAAVCTLRDRVDDLVQFVDALQTNGIDTELQWPQARSDRQRLQASYSPAKHKIAQCMSISII